LGFYKYEIYCACLNLSSHETGMLYNDVMSISCV